MIDQWLYGVEQTKLIILFEGNKRRCYDCVLLTYEWEQKIADRLIIQKMHFKQNQIFHFPLYICMYVDTSKNILFYFFHQRFR